VASTRVLTNPGHRVMAVFDYLHGRNRVLLPQMTTDVDIWIAMDGICLRQRESLKLGKLLRRS